MRNAEEERCKKKKEKENGDFETSNQLATIVYTVLTTYFNLSTY